MLELVKTEANRALDGAANLQSQMTFRFSVLSKLLDKQMTAIAGAHDLSLVEYRALVTTLAFQELSAADLSRYTGYDKGVLSRAVATLSAKGLIGAAPDPSHGLRKILTVTDAGKATLDAIEPAVAARRENLSAALGPSGEAAFLNAIETLVTHLDQETR